MKLRELHQLYRDPAEWNRISVHNTACSGYFSSDRAIEEYAREIWGLRQSEAQNGDAKTTKG